MDSSILRYSYLWFSLQNMTLMDAVGQLMGKCSSLPLNSGHVLKSYFVRDLLMDPFKGLLSNNFWIEKTLTTPDIPSGRRFSFCFGTQKGSCA